MSKVLYKNSFAYHIEVKLGLNLDDIWNWEKNNELGINPYKITKQSNKKVWLYCLENDYHNYDRENNKIGYGIKCNDFYRGSRCGYCNSFASHKVHWKDSFAQWGIDNFGKDFLEKYWSDYNSLNPWKLSPQSHSNIYIYCQKHKYHNYNKENIKIGYKIECQYFYRGNRCNYCHKGKSKVHWKDSLAYKYPNVAKMIAIPKNNLIFEDCYNIKPLSQKKYYFKCNKCNTISNKRKQLDLVIRLGYSCEFCSDGISIPNKFMANILKQLDEDFVTELSSKEFNGKNYFYYDFYLPKHSMIIEINGLQHYEESNRGRSLVEEQMNDLFKYKCAKNHINNYIVIDCRYSKLNWLKENIIKELSDYFDLSNVDWKLAWEESQNSLCMECWSLWNNGFDVNEISNMIKLSKVTVRNYLHQGNQIGKCKYKNKSR